jgi:hypothetical protein
VLASGINALNKPKQPRFGGNLTVQKSPIGSRALILGRTALGGNVCTDLMRTGRNSGVATAVYGLGGVGPVGAIESVIWGADTLTFGGSAGSIQIVNSPSKYSGKPFWIVQKSGAWNQTAINISAGGSGLESGAHPAVWTTNHRLGGFLAVMMIFGAENPIFKDNFHQPIFVVDANAVVMKDPRTAANATTQLQRRNPWVAAYQFAKGFYSETSVKVHGIGLSEDLIDGTSFAAAATIADSNNYTIGGVLQSNPSNVWQDLRSIAQAGGGDVTIRNGKLTAVISAAKTSIGTITEDDLAANPSISAAVEGSQIPNRIIPRFISESNAWQVVDGSVVTDTSFVTAQDGKQITTTIELPLCGGGAAQAGILAAYALVNTREPLSIVLNLKPQARFIGLTGDCVTLNLPSSGLSSHKVLITEMTYRSDLSCQINCLSETDSKHDWALGKTTEAPDYTVTTPYDVSVIPTPSSGVWTATAATLSGGGTILPVINVTGASDWPGATGIVVKTKINGDAEWTDSVVISPNATAHQIRGLKSDTSYIVGVAYLGLNNQEGTPRSLTAVTTASLTVEAALEWTDVLNTDGLKPANNATKNVIYQQVSAPASGTVGDLWIDTDDNNKLYLHNGSAWVLRRDSGIDAALTAASNAQDTADGKIETFYQTGMPTGTVGDLWFDTDDGNKLYRHNGTTFVEARDALIGTAISNASTAQTTANTANSLAATKVITFFATSAPTASAVGDLWYNSSDSLLKRWNGSSWVTVSNSYNNTNQLTDGAGLGTTANWPNVSGTGRPADNATQNIIYQQASQPSGTVGDIWIDTDDSNKLYLHNGSAWVLRRDSGIDSALTAAANAQDTADGKIETFFQTGMPTGTVGDLWFDTDDGNKLYRHNGTTFIETRDAGIATAITNASSAQTTANTKIITFFATSAPTASAVGDLWYNDSDKLLKRWNGSSWIAVSNAYTNTNQLTDGAGLGTTANWPSVTGTGRPADNATQNIVTSGLLSARPAGNNGDFYYATDNKLLYQKVSGTWIASASYNIGALADLDATDTTHIVENATFIDNKFSVQGAINVGWGNEYEFGSVTTTVAGGVVQIFLNGDYSASSLSTGGNLELVFQRVRSGTTLDLATYVFAKTGAGTVTLRSKLFISRASSVLSGDTYKVIMRVTGGVPGGASLFDTDLIITHLKR